MGRYRRMLRGARGSDPARADHYAIASRELEIQTAQLTTIAAATSELIPDAGVFGGVDWNFAAVGVLGGFVYYRENDVCGGRVAGGTPWSKA
jgi:hypothetical protein